MKKLLVLVCGLWLVVGGLTPRPAFAQFYCNEFPGHQCVFNFVSCASLGLIELPGTIDCNLVSPYDKHCCIPAGVTPTPQYPTPTLGPTSTPTPPPVPSSPADCPEGKTYVAIFRTCLDFGEFAGALINWLMIFAAGLAIIKIAAGGIQYIFASGDPKNLENAHATMTSAIVGLMLVLLAWVIMKLIGELTPESWQIRLLGG